MTCVLNLNLIKNGESYLQSGHSRPLLLYYIIYRKDGGGNSGYDRGYVIIPKEQINTNETSGSDNTEGSGGADD